MSLFVPGALALLLFVCPPATRLAAQDPAPTIVITTPTPTRVPLPTPTPQPAATPQPLDGYVVKEGDTLLSVALEMGIDVDEMGCLVRPEFDPSQPLVIGDRLLPMPDGIACVRTNAGDSPRSLAATYHTTPDAIIAETWNQLDATPDLPLEPGRFVRIPLGENRSFDPVMLVSSQDQTPPFLRIMLQQPANTLPQAVMGRGGPRRAAPNAPVPANWPYGTGHFKWPVYGILTQGYRLDHRAVDIAAPIGTPITASDRGVVLRAGWNNQGYGNFVIIDHNIDYLTLYAHMDKILVHEGEVVGEGQVLGTVGSTGNSTGPHLHFEIRDFGRLANPLEFLAQ